MPAAQARLTRTRGLHAVRSSIRSDNYTFSLPERRIARRFFLYRWHRAHTCHPVHFRTATSADRWPPGVQARLTCAPCHGHMCASGEPLGAAGTRRCGWERLFLCERQRFAPSNRPGLLVRPMRVKISLGRVCILRGSRTAGGPVPFRDAGLRGRRDCR